jgi:CheY-like chemotaxis protein
MTDAQGKPAGLLDGLRVLIVDDDEPTLDLSRLVLESEGAFVLSATSGAEALSLIEHHCPDAMITDLSMPSVDGFMLVEQLRRRPASGGGKLPVAAMTARMSGADRVRAFLVGVQAYLVKPVDPIELVKTVRWLTTVTTR